MLFTTANGIMKLMLVVDNAYIQSMSGVPEARLDLSADQGPHTCPGAPFLQ